MWGVLFGIRSEVCSVSNSVVFFIYIDKVGFRGGKERRILWNCVFFVIPWIIWLESIFRNRRIDFIFLWDRVKLSVFFWVKVSGVFSDILIWSEI